MITFPNDNDLSFNRFPKVMQFEMCYSLQENEKIITKSENESVNLCKQLHRAPRSLNFSNILINKRINDMFLKDKQDLY